MRVISPDNWKANSGGQPLVEHSMLVARVGREMGRQAGLAEDILRQIECAGLSHDLGKAVGYFQDYLDGEGEDSAATEKPRHHEISWAFLAARLSSGNFNEPIFNAVYWHHARPVDEKGDHLESRDAILPRVSRDIKRLDALYEALRISDKFDGRGEPQERDVEVPALVWKDGAGDTIANAKMLTIRTFLIAADRCVSGLTPEQFSGLLGGRIVLADFVAQLIGGGARIEAACPDGYNAARFTEQNACARRAATERTVVVRAPAGFGKTMVGILWGLALGRRVLWVCPRNVVAEAVFDNAQREIEALKLPVSMELHLSGERRKSIGLAPEFGSDVVVTNIDSVLSPMVDNRTAGRLFTVLASAVVFDEYHEFATDQPLFAAFVTMMRARHRLCLNSKTLLLSATPSCLHILWENEGNLTSMLPDERSHYPAAHAGRYRIFMAEELPSPVPGALTVVNSVSKCQSLYLRDGYNHIVHSKFTDTDRAEKVASLFMDFGKGGEGVAAGRTAVSSLVVQAAMDVSFKHLSENVCSPEFTLQRIGRCDRWGTFQDANPTITLVCEDAANEDAAIRTVFNAKISGLWRRFLRDEIGQGKEMNLAALYAMYNRFCEAHRDEIRGYLLNCYSEGLEWLVGFAPVKFKGKAAEASSRRGRSLRNPLGSYFFSVCKTSGGWLDPDDVMDEGRELKARFERPGIQRELLNGSRMRPCVKGLYDAGYMRYRRYLKRATLPGTVKHWFRLARSAETPLPDFTREYDNRVGLKERNGRV